MPALHCPGFLTANGDLQKVVGMTCFRQGRGRGRWMRRFSVSCVAEDQRRLGALIVPNKEELLLAARKFSRTDELDVHSRRKIFSKLIRDELTFCRRSVSTCKADGADGFGYYEITTEYQCSGSCVRISPLNKMVFF